MNRYIKIIVTITTIIAVITTATILYTPKTAKAEEVYTIGNEAIYRSVIAKNTNLPEYNNISLNTGNIIVTGTVVNTYVTRSSNTIVQNTNYKFDKIVYETANSTKRIAAYNEGTYKTSLMLVNSSSAYLYKQIIEFDSVSDMNTFLNRKAYTTNGQDVYGYELFEKIENYYQIEEYTPQATADGNFTYTYGYIPYNIGDNGREYGQGVSNSIERNTADTGGFYLQIPNIQGYNYVQIAIQVEHTSPYELMYKDPYLYALNFMNIMPVNNTIRVDYANQAFTEPVEYTISNDGLVEQTDENWSGLISVIQFDVQLSGTENNAIIANIPFASQSYINGYKSAIQYIEAQKQSAYNRGYAEGLGTAETGDFYHLISAVFSVPVSVITGFADVNILGVNMLTVLRGLLTICIIAMVLKFFL